MARTGTRQAEQRPVLTDVLRLGEAPYDLQAEQALLGAILIDNKLMGRVSSFLEPRHFYDPLHEQIFATAGRIIRSGQEANAATVGQALGEAASIGVHLTVPQYVARLAVESSVDTISSLDKIAREVCDLSIRREPISIREGLADLAIDPAIPASAAEVSPTKRSEKIAGLQQLRGLSVFLTICAHEPLATGLFSAFGLNAPYYMGVPIFYAISGYIIFLTTEKNSGWDVGSFYVRRLFRVMPVMVLSCVAAILIAAMLPHGRMVNQFFPPLPEMAWAAAAQVFLVGNFAPYLGIVTPRSIRGLWSISVEAHFYWVFGALLWIDKRMRAVALATLAIALFAAKLWLYETHPDFARSHMFYYEILLIAGSFGCIRHLIKPSPLLFAFGLAFPLLYPFIPKTIVTYAISYPLLVIAVSYAIVCAGSGYILANLRSRLGEVLHWLGERSYVIYVMHFQVISVAGLAMQASGINYSHPFAYKLGLALAIPLAVPLFEFVYARIEQPGIKLGHRIARDLTQVPTQFKSAFKFALRQRGLEHNRPL